MTLTLSGSNGVSGVDGSASTPALQGSDSNTGIHFPAADTVAIDTGGSERLRVDSSGRCGIGDTAPSYKLTSSVSSTNTSISSYTNDNITVAGVNTGSATANQLVPMLFRFADGTYNGNSLIAALRESATGRQQSFVFAPSNSSGDPTERARIDSSGRLLVGTTSGDSNTRLHVSASENTSDPMATDASIVIANTVNAGSNEAAAIKFNLGNTNTASISAHYDSFSAGVNSSLRFYTQYQSAFNSPTERMRIGNNGVFNTFSSSGSFNIRNALGTTTDSALLVYKSATDTSNGTACFVVRTDGDVENTNNSYGSLSDVKLKENIVHAASQWSDIKALQVRKYNFKQETGFDTHIQIGLIAQEVELVSPGLVTESPDRDEDGNDLGTTTKSVNYSVLYMKAVKALQEAMERIESLETRLNALEVQP